MAAKKECPLCGEFMRLSVRETVESVPGQSQQVRHTVREWICPECDYFEEVEGAIADE
jgi:acetone carboxylase gamma subunit